MSMQQIADHLNIHRDTVERRLQYAKKAGLFLDFERQVIETLIPKAIEAVKTALEDGDAETGLEILKAMNVIPDNSVPKTVQQQNDSDDLAKAIEEARKEQAALEGTVDAEIIGGRSPFAGLLEAGGDQSEVDSIEQAGKETVGEVSIQADQGSQKENDKAGTETSA